MNRISDVIFFDLYFMRLQWSRLDIEFQPYELFTEKALPAITLCQNAKFPATLIPGSVSWAYLVMSLKREARSLFSTPCVAKIEHAVKRLRGLWRLLMCNRSAAASIAPSDPCCVAKIPATYSLTIRIDAPRNIWFPRNCRY
ncbi:hypothetical protein ARMGADRAFT_27923 [Armillaria gallica]|uniref:Uncharacterized protein n=1 Tax=Armillaria gallica TaxID=47427 RepID=A0A2H3EC39_ARMGA|nr:hypothetical protein ARMGADRAFT_27923 [Armillaria gallica]